jgi:hypothetical protein
VEEVEVEEEVATAVVGAATASFSHASFMRE